jgi:nitroreductase
METPSASVRFGRRRDLGTRFAVRAASTAPSLHNTQPWCLVSRNDGISLYADYSRNLPRTDPGGRELVVSCGAALFNLHLAMRHLGFAAVIRMLPDPRHPSLLAEVHWGSYRRPEQQEEVLYHAMARRHTHVGAFVARPLPPMLVAELSAAAHAEHGNLVIVGDAGRRRLLAELISGAENAQCTDPAATAELARWVTSSGTRRDGIPVRNRKPDPIAFVDRGFVRAAGRAPAATADADETAHALGIAVLLTTRGDSRLDWLLAGRALQRLLLHAAASGVSAAFHTQPLELPGPRSRIKAKIAAGAYPQLVLRLGYADHLQATPRRPVTDVLVMREPPAGAPPGQAA